MELIKNLTWRYATKKFDKTKKVSAKDIESIKHCIQLSASSYGLQCYKVLIIENEQLRKGLKLYAWNQSQITDASHLFVFCNYKNIENNDVDKFIELTRKERGLKLEDVKGYGDFIKMKLAEETTQEQNNWLTRQVYIALANLLTACAELKIDACPMEGFEAEEFNKLLGLDQKGLEACVLATIGYRDESDETQNYPKVRKPMNELYEII